MLTDEHLLWAGIASCASLHPHLQKLSEMGSATIIWNATREQLKQCSVPAQAIETFIAHRAQCNLQKLKHIIERDAIRVLLFSDNDYPTLLKEIYAPPMVLFARGTLRNPIPHPLAVIGSRKMTAYGERVLESVIKPTISAGCSIISGLALGVDGRAHEHALKENGYTIAILAGGIDDASIYPRQHYGLAQRIIANKGLLLSEFAPRTPALKHHFAQRNRIIAGLSKVICVIEAAQRSGSLITARMGNEQNRIVCAVPGSIFGDVSDGCNRLIAQGAKPILCAQDILDEFNVYASEHKETNNTHETLSPQESHILACLTDTPTHIDDIMQQVDMTMTDTLVALTILETKHKVKQIQGMSYIKWQ